MQFGRIDSNRSVLFHSRADGALNLKDVSNMQLAERDGAGVQVVAAASPYAG